MLNFYHKFNNSLITYTIDIEETIKICVDLSSAMAFDDLEASIHIFPNFDLY